MVRNLFVLSKKIAFVIFLIKKYIKDFGSEELALYLFIYCVNKIFKDYKIDVNLLRILDILGNDNQIELILILSWVISSSSELINNNFLKMLFVKKQNQLRVLLALLNAIIIGLSIYVGLNTH